MSRLGSMPAPPAPPPRPPTPAPRWSPAGPADEAARCCSPADCNHRAMTASLESPMSAACADAPPAPAAAAADPAPPPARRCDLRCGANLAAGCGGIGSRESRGGAAIRRGRVPDLRGVGKCGAADLRANWGKLAGYLAALLRFFISFTLRSFFSRSRWGRESVKKEREEVAGKWSFVQFKKRRFFPFGKQKK